MNHLNIKFKTIEDIFSSLAEKLKIGYKETLGEYSLLIPKDVGEGLINGFQFPSGLSLYNFSCKFNSTTLISFKHQTINPVKIIQCIQGSIESWLKSEKKKHLLKPHQYTIVSSRLGENHTLKFEKDVAYKISYLEVNREIYTESLPFNINDANPLFYDLFHNSHILYGHLLPSSFNIFTSEIVKAVWECDLKGLPRINFLGAKVLEMMASTLSTYQKDIIRNRHKGLKPEEYDAISLIANTINHNLQERKTNKQLAEIAGMTERQLQNCFHKVYGKTVNEYIQDVRLSRALELLQTNENSISEVVNSIGLSSHSYFSRKFKDKYGISPRDLIKSS